MTGAAPHIGFVWDQCGDYHMDRAEAVACALGPGGRVTLFEIATRSRSYDWPECRVSETVNRVTLFAGMEAEDASELPTAWRLLKAIRKAKVTQLFMTGYEHPGRFAVSSLLTLTGNAPVLMLDSKFDDKPRSLRRESLKRLVLLPYRAGLASGTRTAEYMRFLGLRGRPIEQGYNTISVDRMRRLAQGIDPPWQDRDFLIVGRLVPKKNIFVALRAFAAMIDRNRNLRICGDGPLRAELETEARDLGIGDRVVFLGSQRQDAVAREMASALCLMIPSTEEQWGLVVNEALALSLPILASENVGAKDNLIANYVNGFLLESENVKAWVLAMDTLATDEPLWRRFVEASRERAQDGDVARFAQAVVALIQS